MRSFPGKNLKKNFQWLWFFRKTSTDSIQLFLALSAHLLEHAQANSLDKFQNFPISILHSVRANTFLHPEQILEDG